MMSDSSRGSLHHPLEPWIMLPRTLPSVKMTLRMTTELQDNLHRPHRPIAVRIRSARLSVCTALKQVMLFRIGHRRVLARFVKMQNGPTRFGVEACKRFSHVTQVACE